MNVSRRSYGIFVVLLSLKMILFFIMSVGDLKNDFVVVVLYADVLSKFPQNWKIVSN